MANKLTKKQRGFVKDYIVLGNGTQAALANYNTQSPRVAQTIASENLSKPIIAKAISDALPDSLIAERHLELLNSTYVEHLVFPTGPKETVEDDDTKLSDVQITEMLAEVNCKVRRIVRGETARHVYFWSADNRARKDAIDMAYKVKGTYAPEKHANLTMVAEIGDVDVMALATEAAELLKAKKL